MISWEKAYWGDQHIEISASWIWVEKNLKYMKNGRSLTFDEGLMRFVEAKIL